MKPKRRLGWIGTAVAVATTAAACSAAPIHVNAIDDMERVRSSADAQEGARLAPDAYAVAERARRLALDLHAAGDDVGAALNAQRTVAAYAHALVLGRLARATAEQVDAQKALDDTRALLEGVEAARARLELESSGLEDQVRIARERLLPALSASATAEREEARRGAANAMALEARLLCHAARLVEPGASPGDEDTELTKLDEQIARRALPAPIDDATRWRARCLESLTRARRDVGSDVSGEDALLSELSAAGGWDPRRDERGVVVTLRSPFTGPALTATAAARLADLRKVAAAHRDFALQVVLHDAEPRKSKDETDARRAEAIAVELVAVPIEQAGDRAPLVDPRDARERWRNERLDVVFVSAPRS